MDVVFHIIGQHQLALAQIEALGSPEAHALLREGADHQKTLAVQGAFVDIKLFAVLEMLFVVAVDGNGMALAEGDQLAVVVENGVVQLAYQYEYHTPVTLYGNFLQRLCQRNYRVVPKDYMEEKYKKIVFQGLPLNSNYKLLKNRKDCIYLYEKKLEKTR